MAVAATAHLLFVWTVPILPCQDLPQHLSYARILLDYNRTDLPFREYYELPSHFQPYFLSHYLLAAVGRGIGLDGAVRRLQPARSCVTSSLARNRRRA